MFNTSWIIPWTPRAYIPVSLYCNDIHAICFPMLQMHPVWAVRVLIPSIYNGPDFTWEQTTGPHVEISDVKAEKPIITLNIDEGGDVGLRVYMDKGTQYELSANVTIFRTPTGVFEHKYYENRAEQIIPLEAKGIHYDKSILARALAPTDEIMVPSLREYGTEHTYQFPPVQVGSELFGFHLSWQQPKEIELGKHKLVATHIHAADTGKLLHTVYAPTREITLSKNETNIYLVNEIQLYNSVPGKQPTTLKASYGKTVKSPYTFLDEVAIDSIFVTEAPFVHRYKVEGTATNMVKEISGFTNITFTDIPFNVSLNSPYGRNNNNSATLYKGSLFEVQDIDFSIKLGLPSQGTHTFSITRYNGISIGG